MIGTLIATLAWSTSGGPPAPAALQGGAGQTLATVRFAPRVLVGDDQLALVFPDGRVFLSRGDEGWSACQVSAVDWADAVLLPTGDLLVLGRTSGGQRLQRVTADRVVWSVPSRATALYAMGGAVHAREEDALVRVDLDTGELGERMPLDGYRGPLWSSATAWFGVELHDGARHWVRHGLDGKSSRVAVGSELSGLLTQARGVLPDGGAVLVAGHSLVWMSPAGTEQARVELPVDADLDRAVVDERGRTWVVRSGEQGAEVWRVAPDEL